MTTLDFLGYFIGFIRLERGSPIFHRYRLDEYEGECRTSKAVFIRLWPTRWAVAVGRWRPSGRTEEETVEYLMQARNMDLYDDEGNLDPRFEDAARQQIADHASDPDDEWKILSALGLEQ
jgi:hypothetical protein